MNRYFEHPHTRNRTPDVFKRKAGEGHSPADGQGECADDRQYPVAPKFGCRKYSVAQPPDGVKTVGSNWLSEDVVKFYLYNSMEKKTYYGIYLSLLRSDLLFTISTNLLE